MKQILIQIFFLVLFSAQMSAQPKILQGTEEGVLFSALIDSDKGFHTIHYGFGLESGYYVLKKTRKRGMISLDARLAYARIRIDEKYTNNMFGPDIFRDGYFSERTGKVAYDNISIALPFKYRYFLSKKVPLFLLIGFNPNFTLYNKTIFKYDEFRIDKDTYVSTMVEQDQEERIVQNFYNYDIIFPGLGYKNENVMVDIYFSGGGVDFRDDFLSSMEKLSIVLNAYYRLK